MEHLPINYCRISSINSILRTLFISQWFWESRARCQFRFEVPPIFERLDFQNRMKETYLTFLGTNLPPPKLVEKKSFWIGIHRDTVDGRNPPAVDRYRTPLFAGFQTSQVVQEFFPSTVCQRTLLSVFFANPYRELKDSSPDLFALHFQPLLQKTNHLRETWQLTQNSRVFFFAAVKKEGKILSFQQKAVSISLGGLHGSWVFHLVQ